MCTKLNLHSSVIKLMKLVHNQLNVSFLKTLVTNLLFSRNIFTSRKVSDPFISVSIEKINVLMFFIYISQKKLRMSWFIKQNKNIIHISFVINRFEMTQVIFQPITFIIAKKNIILKENPWQLRQFDCNICYQTKQQILFWLMEHHLFRHEISNDLDHSPWYKVSCSLSYKVPWIQRTDLNRPFSYCLFS